MSDEKDLAGNALKGNTLINTTTKEQYTETQIPRMYI